MDGKAVLVAGFVMAGIAADVRGEAAQDRLELTLLVYTETEIPWLPAAQAIVADLYEDAGIRLAWVPCGTAADPASCSRPPAANELVVRIRGKRVDEASHMCGLALRPRQMMGSYVTLFLDCLAEGSKAFRVKESVVAAYCLAHEIAHLLLPTSAHAASGIMQARLSPIDWDRARRGGLRFLAGERRQMVEALRRRTASATSSRVPFQPPPA
jgi:hypothetical protein